MTRARYLVLPGSVISEQDRQQHSIDANTLMYLYKVDPAECVIAPTLNRFTHEAYKLLYARVTSGELIALHPRSNGDYRLPSNSK